MVLCCSNRNHNKDTQVVYQVFGLCPDGNCEPSGNHIIEKTENLKTSLPKPEAGTRKTLLPKLEAGMRNYIYSCHPLTELESNKITMLHWRLQAQLKKRVDKFKSLSENSGRKPFCLWAQLCFLVNIQQVISRMGRCGLCMSTARSLLAPAFSKCSG